eukprot:4381181-Amphidinium_carterae.1
METSIRHRATLLAKAFNPNNLYKQFHILMFFAKLSYVVFYFNGRVYMTTFELNVHCSLRASKIDHGKDAE